MLRSKMHNNPRESLFVLKKLNNLPQKDISILFLQLDFKNEYLLLSNLAFTLSPSQVVETCDLKHQHIEETRN